MKKTILLYDNDPAVIEQFFTQLGDKYTILSCTSRLEDLENHLNLLKPFALVYGISSAKEDIEKIGNIQQFMSNNHCRLCITGAPFNCDYFVHNSLLAADMMVMKPMKTSDIIEALESQPVFQEEETGTAPQTAPENGTAAAPAQNEPAEASQTQDGTTSQGNPSASKDGKPEAKPAAPRKHILVIDDNPMMLKILKQHLHDDYDVATAPGGEIGLKFLATRSTDLILLDFEMPGMNGPQVMKYLKASPKTRDIPVVFLTGTKDKEKVQQALLTKPQGYLLKPIDKTKLLAMISSIL